MSAIGCRAKEGLARACRSPFAGVVAFAGLTACIDVRVVRERDGAIIGRADAGADAGTSGTQGITNGVTSESYSSSPESPSRAARDAGPDGSSEGGLTSPEGGSSTSEGAMVWGLGPGANTPIGGAIAGVNGPALEETVCPFDEVLTGLSVRTNINPQSTRYEAPTRVAALCSSVTITPDAGEWRLELTETRQLRSRGVGFSDDDEQSLRCPDGSVVVGFGGLEGTYGETAPVEYIDSLRFSCAELTVDVEGRLQMGAADATAEIGKAPHASATAFDYQCGSGEVARGVAVAAGSWIDSFGVVCAPARAALAPGSSCETPEDCSSLRCEEGRCLDLPCSPASCECAVYGQKQYAWCALANWSGAQTTCADAGMALATVTNSPENAWLRSTADASGFGDLWIGASDADYEGTWQWVTGTVFWSDGAAQEGSVALWASGEPKASQELTDCAQAREEDGLWTAKDCAQRASFVCQAAIP